MTPKEEGLRILNVNTINHTEISMSKISPNTVYKSKFNFESMVNDGELRAENNKIHGTYTPVPSFNPRLRLGGHSARREPLYEFFSLLLLCMKIKHEKVTEICRLNTNELYRIAIQEDKLPFYRYNEFIDRRVQQVLQDRQFRKH